MGDDEWTVVSKGSRRKMSSTAFRALQVRAEHESGPAEDPPDASVDKTWSQIERAVREIRDAPFAKTLLRRMEDAGFVPYILVDRVKFRDSAPWPSQADGRGATLQRKTGTAFGNDPVNWKADAPTPGRDNRRSEGEDSDGSGPDAEAAGGGL